MLDQCGQLLGSFPPVPLKIESFRPWTEVECIECDETWQGSRLINYLLIGFYFTPCDCYYDVMNDVQIGIRIKIQERNCKKFILVFCIEFYDVW